MKIERKIELYGKKYIYYCQKCEYKFTRNEKWLTSYPFYYLIRYILLFKLLFHCYSIAYYHFILNYSFD